MKFTITKPTEIEVFRVSIRCPADEEDGVPLKMLELGDTFFCYVDIESGVITYPKNIGPAKVHVKAVDRGIYTLIGADNWPIAELRDYVPHGVVPGSYGDYVELDIDEHNKIRNWPAKPDISAWFRQSD